MIAGYNDDKPRNENIEGISVHYLPVYYDNHLGFIQRVISFLKFIYQANKLALRIQDICNDNSSDGGFAGFKY